MEKYDNLWKLKIVVRLLNKRNKMEDSQGHKEKTKKVTWNHMVKDLEYPVKMTYFMTDWIHV